MRKKYETPKFDIEQIKIVSPIMASTGETPVEDATGSGDDLDLDF